MEKVDLDTTYVRLRAVRKVNIELYVFGLIMGTCLGLLVGMLIWR